MDNAARDLENLGYSGDLSNTQEKCFESCRKRNFKYAGLQAGSECWCSNTFGKLGKTTLDSQCFKPCTGNVKQICGGDWANSIYDLIPESTVYGELYIQYYKEINIGFLYCTIGCK